MRERIEHIAKTLKLKLPNFKCPDVGQTPGEIIHTLKIVKKLKPRIILEIGSARGGFIYLLSALFPTDTVFITIDPWTKGTKYEKQYLTYNKTIHDLQTNYSKNKYLHIRGKSEDQKVIKKLRKILNDKKIDFLFIDGHHTYRNVLNDWQSYRPFLSKKAIAAFHDIVAYDGVNQAWKKIVSENKGYQHTEFKRKGQPLLTDLSQADKKKFSKPIILGIGYMYKIT